MRRFFERGKCEQTDAAFAVSSLGQYPGEAKKKEFEAMFAFLATRNPIHPSRYTSEVRALAEQYEISANALHTLTLPNFQLDLFDTGNELQHYTDGRYMLLMAGMILNKKSLARKFGISTSNDAELVLNLFQIDRTNLSKVDGHLSVIIFDSVEQSFCLVGDRFLRYSFVFSINTETQVSSHSRLLFPFLPDRVIDQDALSQSVHFRWMTGDRRLLSGVQQVLAGSITRIGVSGSVDREAYWKLRFERESNLDLDYWMREVDEALDRVLANIAKRHEVIGVPLSGGVDSSLLLAKAKEHFRDCIAVTGRFQNGANPEFENACNIAKHLGVRHIIAEVDDHYVRDFFPEAVRLHEQPIRNYSDIALGKVLYTIKQEAGAFLYGEAADTLFGLKAIHRIAKAHRTAALFQKLPPVLRSLASRMLPSNRGQFSHLKSILEEGNGALIYRIERIMYSTPPWRVFPCEREPSIDKVLDEFLAHESFEVLDRASIQLLATGVVNHIENTGRLATRFDLEMYVPFVLNDLRSVALRLPAEMQGKNGRYKKVLRELACRYIPSELVYTKKFGFPTPEKNWLKGPLGDRVRKSVEGYGAAAQFYSPDSLSALSIDEDYEHFWFAICLDELLMHLDSAFWGVQTAA